MKHTTKRFRVAISFAGEKRDYVARVATILAGRFGRSAILYDQYHEAEFARSDLGFYLPRLYREHSDLIVVVLCPDYEANEWCGLEWNAIFDLLKSRRNEEVMLLRFGHALVQGLYSTAGFVELDEKTPEQTAAVILQRLARNDAKATDEFDPSGPGDHSIARSFHRTASAFLDEYLVSETGEVPFGGRDGELRRLDAWLFDPKAAPRMLVAAPAGRGKSALLVHWMKSLRNLPQFTEEGWQLAFVPISIRVGTNRPSTFYGGLAQRLADITGESVPPEAIHNADALKGFIQDRLEEAASAGRRLLVVLDGLDEALQGSFDPSIIPPRLPFNLRIVVSARWQVGDNDSTGWLRKLGWDRNVRAEQLELERLRSEAIADVLLKLGAPTDVLARQRDIVDRLCGLTEGEPILVRYYAEDLWQLGQQRARIVIGDLESLNPGFGSYFERWLSHQERLWAEEGQSIDRLDVDRALSILAFALGPLASRDLLDLMSEIHEAASLLSEHHLLQPLRRFVIGNGRTDSGYVLSHPKIAEYLQRQRFGGRSIDLRRGFATWGQKHLRKLNDGEIAPQHASPYALQFLKEHFKDAGLSAHEWMEFVENGWRCAWEKFEGVPQGFASNVQAAWDVVRRDPGGSAIGAQWRCALVLSSIRSIGLNTPDALLCSAVVHRQLSIRQAVHFVETGRSGKNAVSLLLELSRLNTLTPTQSTDLISVAL